MRAREALAAAREEEQETLEVAPVGCANFPKMFEKNGEIEKLKKRGYCRVHFCYTKLYPKGF